MVWINYQCINEKTAPGVMGGAICMCEKCEVKRKEEYENNRPKYEVYSNDKLGGYLEKKYNTLEEALDYVEKNKNLRSYAIKYPNGNWHNWYIWSKA